MGDVILILLPGAMYFWVLFIGQWPLQEVLQEKESRVLPRILACPVTPGQYVLSKLLRCFVLCSLAVILLLVASALLFGIKWGNPLELAAVVATWAGSMTGLLAVVFSLARTKEQANVFSPLVLLTCAMLGGSMFPFENMPQVLQMIGSYTPNRWAVLGLQAVARAKPLTDVIWPLAGLLLMGAVGCVLGFVLFMRQLAPDRRR